MNTWLHLGLGSFHRAHQAWYLHRLRQTVDASWQVVAGNLRDDMETTARALAAQGGAYTLETVSPAGQRQHERITSIREVVLFEPTLARLIEVGASASTPVISFTVTEAGYHLDPQDKLDLTQADLKSDVEHGTRRTLYGAVAAILRVRMAASGAPVTLLCCDNLRSNGTRFRAGLQAFVQQRGEDTLLRWVQQHTRCPSGMVDRITPRPPPELAERVRAATGFADAAPVMGEDFIQWVIEDSFVAGRPALEQVGVEMVGSVHAHEEAKIRILNATHSCVAWAGTLKGLTHIHESMAVPAVRQMAFDYVTQDVVPSLQPSSLDLLRYRDVVLERFGNPHVRDTNQRVAMDGFSKIPGFVVPTLAERLRRGVAPLATAMLPALFFGFLAHWHRGELAYEYQDGVMDHAAAHALFAAPNPLAAFCADRQLFGPLAGDEALAGCIRQAHQRVLAFEMS